MSIAYTKFSRLSLAAKIKRMKNLQAKYFTGENVPIYGISRALRMFRIYYTQPLARFVPSGFGAINPIHPSHP